MATIDETLAKAPMPATPTAQDPMRQGYRRPDTVDPYAPPMPVAPTPAPAPTVVQRPPYALGYRRPV